MKKYLTFKDDKSDKFWNIEVAGNSFTVTYGKTGTSGQTQTKTFDNEQECLNEIDRLIKEKIEKNYIPEKNDIYFWLGTDGHENVYMQKEKGLNSHISLILGKEMDIIKDEIKLPYRYKMCVVENQTPKTYALYPGSHLMHESFIDLIEKQGVKNLQIFPTEITHKNTSEVVLGYMTVNIVGHPKFFNGVINQATDLIFRASGNIIVHYSIYKAFKDSGLQLLGLTFTLPRRQGNLLNPVDF